MNEANAGLHRAVISGDSTRVRAALKVSGIQINKKDDHGMTALHHSDFSMTALQHAALRGHLQVVKALLEHEGIDPNVKGPHGMTAIQIAVKVRQFPVMHLLRVVPGIDLNSQDDYGNTLIHYVAATF